MLRNLVWFFSAIVMLVVSAPLHALNYEVGGCKTGAGYVNFTTISAAVTGVPAGSRIEICPGTYPEQVTITQPLTLQGIASGNANRAVITLNPNGGFVPNVTSIQLGPVYAQVLVENVSPAGPVDIIGITVDGSGANAGCSSLTLAGIFYASDTSGTVNEVTARNQVNGDCAWGIWVENGGGTNATATIENSSVRNQGTSGGGIGVFTFTPTTLTATVSGNFLSNAGGNAILSSTNGEISGNVVTASTYPAPVVYADGPLVVSGNTLADAVEGLTIDSANAVESNTLSNVGTAIAFSGGVGAAIKTNTIKNTTCGIAGAGSRATTSGNTLNDASYGFVNWGGFSGNSLYNADNVQSSSASCP
jgi:hypothetical protein